MSPFVSIVTAILLGIGLFVFLIKPILNESEFYFSVSWHGLGKSLLISFLVYAVFHFIFNGIGL